MTASPDAPWSAEEFYVDLLARVNLFTELSRSYADAGRTEAAVVSQWGADVLTLQSVAWERIVVVSRSPQEPLFEIGTRALKGMGVGDLTMASEAVLAPAAAAKANPSAAALIRAAREAVMRGLDDDLRGEAMARLRPLDHLEGLRAPQSADFIAAARARLAGMEPEAFIRQHRADAAARMAFSRQSADLAAAISAAYEADMLTLDAYLVESALRIGDTMLFTVQLRWDYAAAAVTRLAGVPADLREAAVLVRRTLARSLGAADGARLERTWIPID